MHEGSMLMKSRSRQAFGQGVGDGEGTPTFVKLDFAGTYSWGQEETGRSLIEERRGRRSPGRRRWQ